MGVCVETDINMHCPELVDRLATGAEKDLKGNIEWWTEWGKRLHDAKVEIEELVMRGHIMSDAVPIIVSDDFEEYVALQEGFAERLNKNSAADVARGLGSTP